MDMSRYRDLFVAEAREHLRLMGDQVVALEQNSGDHDLVNALFREAHSIKGMAASMGYLDISGLSHLLEELMDRIRKGQLTFNSEVADLLLEGADFLDTMIVAVAEGDSREFNYASLAARLAGYEPGKSPAITVVTASAAATQPVPEMEGRLTSAEETMPSLEPRRNVRVRAEVLDHLITYTGELLTMKHRLADVGRELSSRRLDDTVQELARLVRRMYNEVLQVRMMPFSVVCERFPRMMRDLAKKSGKEISFVMEGKDIELDRGVLDELPDPLVHILRNAVDHGIEPPLERCAAGKSPSGKIKLSVRREKDQVIVVVEDDGRGIDPERLRAAAIGRGIVTPREADAMSDREALMLVCRPGFSTALQVTEVSGRGVGMDAVQAVVKTVGGSLVVESEPGSGSRIILRLPLTASIIPVLLVACGDMTVAAPVINIERTVELAQSAIVDEVDRKIFLLENEEIPLLNLNRILGQEAGRAAGSTVPVVITEIRGIRTGLIVDRFLGQQEVYLRQLGRPLDKLRGLTGGSILGDGRVVFVLDVANLL